MQGNITNTSVLEQSSGGSISVPSGEIWICRVMLQPTSDSSNNSTLNSVRYYRNGNERDTVPPWDTVLVGGDTFSLAGNHDMTITGFVANDGGGTVTVENNTVRADLGWDESTSVPSGETWYVTIQMFPTGGADANGTKINGVEISHGWAGNAGEKNFYHLQGVVLTGDDTITSGANNTTHIAGWVVN
jgi:hypothetical protein